jgi:hypothetical protein
MRLLALIRTPQVLRDNRNQLERAPTARSVMTMKRASAMLEAVAMANPHAVERGG